MRISRKWESFHLPGFLRILGFSGVSVPYVLRSLALALLVLVDSGDSRSPKTAKSRVPGKLLPDLRRAACRNRIKSGLSERVCRRSLEVEGKRPRNIHDLHAYAEVAELADALDSKSASDKPGPR